jgi:membrane protease YdiL (CAAX protease family)
VLAGLALAVWVSPKGDTEDKKGAAEPVVGQSSAEPTRSFTETAERLWNVVENNPEGAIVLYTAMVLMFGVLLAGHGVLLWWVACLLLGKSVPAPPGPWLERRWNLWDVLKTIVVYFFVCMATVSVCEVLRQADGFRLWFDGLSKMEQSLLAQFPASVLICGLIAYIVRIEKGHDLRELGFRPALKPAVAGVLGYLAALPVVAVVALASLWCVNALGLEPQGHPISSEFLEADSPWAVAAMAGFACLLAPVWEELFFRGMFYPVVRRLAGARLSIAVTAAAFASLHGNLSQFAPIFVLGVLLAYLYEKTHSLWSCIAAHAVFNTASILVLMVIRYSLGGIEI